MATRAQNSFDNVDSPSGSIAPGWVAIGSSAWAVGTANPISGARSFGSTTKGSLDVAVLTGGPAAAADMGVKISQKIATLAGSDTPTVGPGLRCSADGDNGYFLLFDSFTTSGFSINFFNRVGGTYNQVGSSAPVTLSMANGDTLNIRAVIISGSLTVYASTNANALPGSPQVTHAMTGVTAAGFPGLIYSTGGLTTPTVDADDFVWDDSAGGTPMTAGTATVGSTTSTTAAATATAPTGGASPYTHQWFRSTSSGILGSLVSGQTSTTLADTGLAASTSYFYALQQTDANGDIVYTNQITETTSASAGPATSYTLTGPPTGTVGSASTTFTITPNGIPSPNLVVSIGLSAGATASPAGPFTFSTAAPQTFTITASTAGAKTVTPTHTGGGFAGEPTALTYTASAGPLYSRVDATDTRTGQSIMVLVPSSGSTNPYNSANPTGVILYVHGAGEDQQALLTDSLKASTIAVLLDAGYILAGSNAHGDNWGSQASVDDYSGLDEYVRANYNVSSVCLWSQSMGGMDGLLALAQNKVRGVVGWLGTYPVCNLANLYGLGTFTSAINTAFGITGSGILTYAHQTRGSDPVLMTGLAFRNVPMRFYASAGDTVVPKANNTDVLKTLVNSSTRESVVVVCTGNHGDPSHFQPSDYLSFFQRCFASPVATSGIPGSGAIVGAAVRVPGAALLSNGQTIPLI